MSNDDIYRTACELADQLAEDELAANMAEMFVENSQEKASIVRAMSKTDPNNPLPALCEYHAIRRSVYGAVYSLLEGYGGYKLVKEIRLL